MAVNWLSSLLEERIRRTVKVKVAVEPVSEVMCEALPSVNAIRGDEEARLAEARAEELGVSCRSLQAPP